MSKRREGSKIRTGRSANINMIDLPLNSLFTILGAHMYSRGQLESLIVIWLLFSLYIPNFCFRTYY